MITEKQIITWIESKEARPACPELDIDEINNGDKQVLYFFKNKLNLMWLLTDVNESLVINHQKFGKIYETTLEDILSEVRDLCISKIMI